MAVGTCCVELPLAAVTLIDVVVLAFAFAVVAFRNFVVDAAAAVQCAVACLIAGAGLFEFPLIVFAVVQFLAFALKGVERALRTQINERIAGFAGCAFLQKFPLAVYAAVEVVACAFSAAVLTFGIIDALTGGCIACLTGRAFIYLMPFCILAIVKR